MLNRQSGRRLRSSRSRRARVIACAAATVSTWLASSRNSSAVTFNLIPASGTSQQAIDGFTAAAQRWSSLLSDNVTVNLNIGFTSLDPGILGQAESFDQTFNYTDVRNAFASRRVTSDDFTAYSNLQTGAGVRMLINYTANNPNGSGSATPYLDDNGDDNNTNIRINLANAKALGLLPANGAAVDASITFSSNFSWDFDPKDGISGGYDFVGVATHEMGHALGFVSGVDVLDFNSPGSNGPHNESDFTYVSPLDLFRFSADSITAGGAGTIDWTADPRAKYFSIDGGATNLGQFATGTIHGDGRQASHWKDNLGLGIMDPTVGGGELMQITPLDWQAMDVIGWTPANMWSWIDPAGGNFAAAVKWSSDLVPQATQDALFNLDATYTIAFTAAASTNNSNIRAGSIAFALGGNTYTVCSGLNVAPAASDVATLRIAGGTVSSVTAGIGGDVIFPGGTGTLSLDAAGVLNVTNNLRIWSAGTLILNGGNISAGLIELRGGTIRSATSATIASPIAPTGGTIQTDAGTLAITGALSTAPSTTLIKAGPGTLTIAGPQSHGVGAVLTLSAGVTNLNSNAGNVSSPGTLIVNANATTNFNAPQNLAALDVGAGATTTLLPGGGRSIKTGTLSIDPAGRLDLTDRALLVDYIGASVESQVGGYLASGRNGGSWDGPGIESTSVGGGILHSLGYAEASEALNLTGTQTALWMGQTVDATSVLVKYTYGGDANLDGKIDISDYGRIDFNVPLGASGWFNGDFNYDGKIDISDYGIIDFNIGIQGPPLTGAPEAQAGLARVASVPEPALLPMLFVAGFGIRRRRCRRRRCRRVSA